MRLNLLLSQEIDDDQETIRFLDSVTLPRNDFPWLEDMRLLAKCGQAHKTGNSAKEADLRKQFFVRQPMLFEPDNAVNFNLLRYQETLKNDFRKTRQKATKQSGWPHAPLGANNGNSKQTF